PVRTLRLSVMARGLRPAGARSNGLRRAGDRRKHVEPPGGDRSCGCAIRSLRPRCDRAQDGAGAWRSALSAHVAQPRIAAGGEILVGYHGTTGDRNVGAHATRATAPLGASFAVRSKAETGLRLAAAARENRNRGL